MCGNLDEVGEEDDDLLVLVLGQNLEVSVPLPQEVHLLQDPLSTVRALPKITGHDPGLG